MYNTEKNWHRQWWALSALEKVRFLTEENAYFIWERRQRLGLPGTAESDWKEAEAFVREGWPNICAQARRRLENWSVA